MYKEYFFADLYMHISVKPLSDVAPLSGLKFAGLVCLHMEILRINHYDGFRPRSGGSLFNGTVCT